MTATQMTATEIAQLTAIVLGETGYKRAATKEAAVRRFLKVCEPLDIRGDAFLALPRFNAAADHLRALIGERAAAAAGAVVRTVDEVAEAEAVEANPHARSNEIIGAFVASGGLDEVRAEVAEKRAARRAALAVAEEVAPPAPPAKPAREPGAIREGSKKAVMLAMVCTETGATEAEICEAIGWKACMVTLRRAAAQAKINLTPIREKGKPTRWVGYRP